MKTYHYMCVRMLSQLRLIALGIANGNPKKYQLSAN